MSMGTNKTKNNRNSPKGKLSPGFNNNPYDILDDLFYDPDEEIYIKSQNKYFSFGVKKFLEEMNFTFKDSELTDSIFVVSLSGGFFKFLEETEKNIEKIRMDIPYDWNEFEETIKNYVSENPIVKKEVVEKNPDNWTTPPGEESSDGDLIDQGIKGIKNMAKAIKKQFNPTKEDMESSITDWSNQLRHTRNNVTYPAKGNPELKLHSGIYENIFDLIRKHDWVDAFIEIFDEDPVKYMNKNHSKENIEIEILNKFGFGYVVDDNLIKVEKIENWTKRYIEVEFEGIDEEKRIIEEKMAGIMEEIENESEQNETESSPPA